MPDLLSRFTLGGKAVVFTCITESNGIFHLSQHTSSTPDAALREHVAVLPVDDGVDPFDAELDWLLKVSDGATELELIPVSDCPGTWLWIDGARHQPQYSTYIVRTDVRVT
ncbi:hypothetical protein [Algisphaera agarilytica]|uniref:Uncharacterized protein n=1 Tax=Algisphaera agarilytica TaxID=1385975 RepID=A0A7X0H731_9BACT|nr:hypothetical protein [Algisphaera agarilytica]MBB6430267.1 hypothetical protein [Algisphaera agarilytica]